MINNYFYILIISLCSVILAQNEYPYFSNPNKQIEFEEKKITIVEIDETEEYYTHTGGESWTEMANTWGYILFDESPSYVVKQNPVKTQINYKHIYEFKIIQGNKQMSELEFLYYAGYSEKAKAIYKEQYEEPMKPYNIDLKTYEKRMEYYQEDYNQWLKENKQTTEVRSETGTKQVENPALAPLLLTWMGSGLWGIIDGLICFSGNDVACSRARTAGIICGSSFLLLLVTDPHIDQEYTSEKNFLVNSIEEPKKPTKPSKPNPTITQVYTNQQITSLAEAYNRRLYEEIKNK